MQVSITQLILRISPPAEYEFRIPVFHIHVPRYCAYGKLRAAGDSETLDLTCSFLKMNACGRRYGTRPTALSCIIYTHLYLDSALIGNEIATGAG